ncbi:MAG: hypothetical protein NTV56_13605 [Alphaproteobacteria bacterium]|nr:hypothetical protein [Alphaproteobacteria bacterium]
MPKSIVLSAALLLSLGVAAAQAQTQGQSQGQYQAQSQPQYNGIEPAAKLSRYSDQRRPVNAEQLPVNIDKVPPPVGNPPYRAPVSDAPYRSADAPGDCANCPPPRQYDSTEVVKNSRDVDNSRVINTQSEVIVPPKVREINKLVIQENETRNIGTIEHNHQIIEKEIRYVRRAPVRHAPAHRPAKRVEMVLVAVPQRGCGCGGQSYTYTYVPAQQPVYAPVQQYAVVPQQYAVHQQYAVVPVAQPRAYGYQPAQSAYYAYR